MPAEGSDPEREPRRFAGASDFVTHRLTVTTPRATRYVSLPLLVLWAAMLPLTYFLLRLVLYARTWPIVHDAAILHYVVFMIGSGRAPYTGMIEMNLPGALMSEWFGMHVFGGSPAGLWRWDTCMGLLATVAAAATVGQGYRTAGVAGALFTWTLHLNDAAFDLAERDWLIAALWLVAIACAAEAIERRNAVWMGGCFAVAGWCCGQCCLLSHYGRCAAAGGAFFCGRASELCCRPRPRCFTSRIGPARFWHLSIRSARWVHGTDR